MPQNNTRKQKWRIKSKELETEYLGNDFTAVQQIETSSTKIYECNVCGKNFELLSSLNKHKAKSHVAHEGLYLSAFYNRTLKYAFNFYVPT